MKDNNEVNLDEEIINQVAETEEFHEGEQTGVEENSTTEDPKTQETEITEGTGGEDNAEVQEEPELIDGLEIPKPDLEDDEELPDVKKQRAAWFELRQREKEIKRKEEERQRELDKEHEAVIKAQAQQAALQIAAHAPNRDDFADEQEYTEAMVNFTLAKRQVQMQAESNARNQLKAQQKFQDEIESTRSKGAAKYSDFDEIVEPLFLPGEVPKNIPMVDAINESKYGADILYMLGKNKAKAIEVASMPPLKAAKWVWETERKFEEARAKSKPQASTVKVMPKVSSKLSPTKDISQMSVKEYSAYWKKRKFG